MISHSLLYEFPEFINTRIGIFLLKIIEDKNGVLLDPTKFDWSIYKKINKMDYNIKPRNIFKNKLFNRFLIENTDSPKIYTIY